MTDKLKNCPFCGSSNLKEGGDDKWVGVWCLDCEAAGPNGYAAKAAWNTRADDWNSNMDEAPRYRRMDGARIDLLLPKRDGEIVRASDCYYSASRQRWYDKQGAVFANPIAWKPITLPEVKG